MKALVQRVSQAAVDVEGERVAQIGPGMLILLGVGRDDDVAKVDRLAEKVRALRIFDDARKGNRPITSKLRLAHRPSRSTTASVSASAPRKGCSAPAWASPSSTTGR